MRRMQAGELTTMRAMEVGPRPRGVGVVPAGIQGRGFSPDGRATSFRVVKVAKARASRAKQSRKRNG